MLRARRRISDNRMPRSRIPGQSRCFHTGQLHHIPFRRECPTLPAGCISLNPDTTRSLRTASGTSPKIPPPHLAPAVEVDPRTAIGTLDAERAGFSWLGRWCFASWPFLVDEPHARQVRGSAGVAQRVEPVVRAADAFPFDDHALAGHELFGLRLRREVLGQRQMLVRRGFVERDRARAFQRRGQPLIVVFARSPLRRATARG